MIIVENMSLHLPQGFLYENVSVQMKESEKIGLVGKNGAGKSTFLKLLSKEIQPSYGKVLIPKDFKLGFLSQDIIINSEQSLFDFIKDSNIELNKLLEGIEKINLELSTREDFESESYSKAIENLNVYHDQLNHLGFESWEKDIEITLLGLGFSKKDFTKKINDFSGGWKMRAELARILINQPNILLLDEPTNHLDIVTIQWLENYLKEFKGILILISHDRLFLDNVTTRTLEIIHAKLKDYPFPYTKYKKVREEELQNIDLAKKNQEKEIKNTKELIEKFRYKKNKAAFAQSLIKKLEKTEIIESESDEIRSASINFPVSIVSGKKVLDVELKNKSYSDQLILRESDQVLMRGKKIALLGANGTGKSTFIKCVMGETEYEGNILIGHNVKIGYFAQDSSKHLNTKHSVYDVIDEIAVGEKRKDIRSMLGAFLFSGEDIDKKVSVLSGGEKTRLGLCKLLFSESNFLILDEPTNHLDIQSKNVLKAALKNYEGTLLIVSHDREFLDGLYDEIWEFVDGKLKVVYGNIEEYLKSKTTDSLLFDDKQESQSKEKKVSKENDYLKNKEQKRIKNKIRNLEQSISKIELEIEEKRALLYQEDIVTNVEKLSEIDSEINQLEAALEEKMMEWEEQNELLDT